MRCHLGADSPTSDRAPIKEDIIAYCLADTLSNRSQLKEKLKLLCLKDSNRDSVLVQSLDGVYRFTGMAAEGFIDELEKTVESRKIKPIVHLRNILNQDPSYIDKYIEASRYEDDYSINRKLTVECVSVEELSSPSRWLDNIGKGEFFDGYALIVIGEDLQEINKAKEHIKNKLKHTQILFAVPKAGVKLSTLLRYHEAIEHMGVTNPSMYGKGGHLYEEWEEHYRDYNDHIVKGIDTLMKPESEKLEWIMNGEVQSNIRSKSHISELASKMMFSVFNLTPKIVHDKLTSDDGTDSFKRYRQDVVEKILLKDGPKILSQETSKPHRNIIDSFYKRNGILKIQNKVVEIDAPNEAEYPSMSAVWTTIEEGINNAKNSNGIPISMSDIINTLRKPPYGLRTRSIPLILAAVLRKENLLGNISLLEGTKRVEKINSEIIDKAVFSATSIKLHYEAFGEIQKAILYGVAKSFDLDTSKEKDKGELVTEIHDAFKKWWFGLSQYSQTTYQINKQVAWIRDNILKNLINDDSDVYQVLMQDLAMKLQPEQGKRITKELVALNFKRWKNEIEDAVQNQLNPSIKIAICEVFEWKKNEKWNDALASWWKALSKVQQEVRIPGDPSVLAILCADNAIGELLDDERLCGLAENITGLKLQNWNDSTLDQFKGSLRGAKRTSESYVTPITKTEKSVKIPSGKAMVTVSTEEGTVSRTFVKVDKYSPGGINFKNTLKGIIEGMGSTMPAGECETILIEIIKDYLK
jgi:hypothetical protein